MTRRISELLLTLAMFLAPRAAENLGQLPHRCSDALTRFAQVA